MKILLTQRNIMKIEVNNVYQRKGISKIKVGLILALVIFLMIVLVWRLYYERIETNTVSSFSEFIGYDEVEKEESDIIKDLESSLKNELDKYMTTNKYIPNFTEQSANNINSIYKSQGEGKKIVYLTFDDGPSRDVTPLILDVLKEENIYATFFVLGSKVEQNPEILKRIYDEGHYIGNHGYSHVYSQIYVSKDTVLGEYNKCEEIIQKALEIPNYSTHLFRFPGGSSGGPYDAIKKESVKMFEENNVGILDWNCLTRDSEGNFPKEELVQNFKETSSGKNNLVILMHDASGKILVPEVLKEIITYLKNEGYIFGNMRELI